MSLMMILIIVLICGFAVFCGVGLVNVINENKDKKDKNKND